MTSHVLSFQDETSWFIHRSSPFRTLGVSTGIHKWMWKYHRNASGSCQRATLVYDSLSLNPQSFLKPSVTIWCTSCLPSHMPSPVLWTLTSSSQPDALKINAFKHVYDGYVHIYICIYNYIYIWYSRKVSFLGGMLHVGVPQKICIRIYTYMLTHTPDRRVSEFIFIYFLYSRGFLFCLVFSICFIFLLSRVVFLTCILSKSDCIPLKGNMVLA